MSVVGLGSGQLGEASVPEAQALRLIERALDLGINLIDTADSYGSAAERLAPVLKTNRGSVVLSAKVGRHRGQAPEWSTESIVESTEDLLRRLGTDVIDILRLRTMPLSVLERGEATRALEELKAQGKCRFVAFSGENEELARAIAADVFDVVLTSVNVCDQASVTTTIPDARRRRLGVIAKRPLANAPWRFPQRPSGHYGEAYWERFSAMGFDRDAKWPERALRFSMFADGVDACVIGTSSERNLEAAVESAGAGALPADESDRIREAYARHGSGWRGLV